MRKMKDRWNDQQAEMKRILDKYGIEYPACGADVGLGWTPIVEEALEEMVEAGWDKQLDQIKQKFCELRIYASRCNKNGEIVDAVSKAINVAAKKASIACEDCGAPHGLEVPRSGSALCPACRENRNQEKA